MTCFLLIFILAAWEDWWLNSFYIKQSWITMTSSWIILLGWYVFLCVEFCDYLCACEYDLTISASQVFYSCPHFGSKLADMPWRMGLVFRPAPSVWSSIPHLISLLTNFDSFRLLYMFWHLILIDWGVKKWISKTSWTERFCASTPQQRISWCS
jgi:hypothetical protein